MVDSSDIDADLLSRLWELGAVEDADSKPAPTPSTAEVEPDIPEVKEEKPEPKSSAYPSLPRKSAPVSEWEEYARKNEIKLTGLKSRNEKIGYITKVVAGE
ncbi:hypothetical protein ACTXJY_00230 [Corynebacterium casei]|uniref:hypothetical protein n=1 Tax=Corynebacterium casei TaxID=160386 RepID=UPI003FD1C40F